MKLFIELLIGAGYEIGCFLVKPTSQNSVQPNSVDKSAANDISALGIEVLCEPDGTFPHYSFFQSNSFLDELLVRQANLAAASGKKLVIVDVGGWFADPLTKAAQKTIDQIHGVVEVTTAGLNRYTASITSIPLPVFHLARSPLKNAEAAHVGESVVRATEDVLQDVGLILSARKCGVIGYGMIGRRIASSLAKRGADVTVGDVSASASLSARLDHLKTLTVPELLRSCDLIFSATAQQSVKASDLDGARDGLVLISGGSKANEFDVAGIKAVSVSSTAISSHLTKYTLPWNNACVLANEGRAINFLKGGTPEELMDLVLAETAACIQSVVQSNQPAGHLYELPGGERDAIATFWLKLHQNSAPDLFKA